MGQMIIPQQDIVNAICIDQSRKRHVQPEEVEVELMYDDNKGYTADAYINGVKYSLQTIDMIEALRLWLDEILNEDPYAGIKLAIDEAEGMIAIISK